MAKSSICELAAVLSKREMDEALIDVHEVGKAAFSLSGTQWPISRIGEKKIVYFCSFDHLRQWCVKQATHLAAMGVGDGR